MLAVQATHHHEFIQNPSSFLSVARAVTPRQRNHQLVSCRHADLPHVRPHRCTPVGSKLDEATGRPLGAFQARQCVVFAKSVSRGEAEQVPANPKPTADATNEPPVDLVQPAIFLRSKPAQSAPVRSVRAPRRKDIAVTLVASAQRAAAPVSDRVGAPAGWWLTAVLQRPGAAPGGRGRCGRQQTVQGRIGETANATGEWVVRHSIG